MRKNKIYSLVSLFFLLCGIIWWPYATKDVDAKPVVDTVVEKYYVEGHTIEINVNTTEVDLIAKTVYGEARGLTTLEQSAVIWCILNRVDKGYGDIAEVVTAPYQFVGYDKDHPVTEEIKALTEDVLARWQAEKYCMGNVGRTLPKKYLYFYGDGQHNYFRDKYSGDYNTWDWNCENPYK